MFYSNNDRITVLPLLPSSESSRTAPENQRNLYHAIAAHMNQSVKPGTQGTEIFTLKIAYFFILTAEPSIMPGVLSVEQLSMITIS